MFLSILSILIKIIIIFNDIINVIIIFKTKKLFLFFFYQGQPKVFHTTEGSRDDFKKTLKRVFERGGGRMDGWMDGWMDEWMDG